jgi:hypothetical protein
MTLYRMDCDGCKRLLKKDDNYAFENRQFMETFARKNGWEVSRYGKCYCPNCGKKNEWEGE